MGRMDTRIYNPGRQRIVYDRHGHGIDPGQWADTTRADPVTSRLITAGLLHHTTPEPEPEPAPEPEAGPDDTTPHEATPAPAKSRGRKKENN